MKYKKTVLKNGLRVITVPQKEAQAVTVLIMVTTGSHYEEKKISGVSHFLEHLCFKGTEKRPTALEIGTELDSLGASSNAFTNTEYTGYYAKSHPKHLYKILDIVSDIYLNPVFPEIEIEKEKGVIIDEINMYEDHPPHKVSEIYDRLLYGDQPAGRPILGTKETITQMTRTDIVGYRNQQYVPSSTILIVSGKFKERELLNNVEKIFGKVPSSKPKKIFKTTESQDAPKLQVHYKETDQTHIILGVRTFSYFDKRKPALKMLSTILGRGTSSRLFERIREQMGVGYYVSAGTHMQYDYGTLYARTGVDNSRSLEVVKAILEEMNKLRLERVTEKELDKVKEYYLGNLFLSLETSDAMGEFYGDQELIYGKIKTPEEFEKEIRKVTTKDIQKLAEQIFTNDKLNLAMVGPIKDLKPYKKILKF